MAFRNALLAAVIEGVGAAGYFLGSVPQIHIVLIALALVAGPVTVGILTYGFEWWLSREITILVGLCEEPRGPLMSPEERRVWLQSPTGVVMPASKEGHYFAIETRRCKLTRWEAVGTGLPYVRGIGEDSSRWYMTHHEFLPRDGIRFRFELTLTR